MAIRYSIVATCLLCLSLTGQAADPVTDALQVLDRAGSQGKGSAAAQAAAESLLQHGIEILPNLFRHMDTENLVAANWHRYVYQQIVDRELTKPEPRIPAPFLRDYILDSKHQGRARHEVALRWARVFRGGELVWIFSLPRGRSRPP